MFEALLRTRLITDRNGCNYHRCGRTDKGVSAFSQVISLDVRSNCRDGPGVFPMAADAPLQAGLPEINYCKMLNKSLPKEIKFYAWAPVEAEFSARFNCSRRTYRYFFPAGSLDLRAMRDAGQRLVGQHDFRNFAKLDRTKLENSFNRNIFAVRIRPFLAEGGGGGGEPTDEVDTEQVEPDEILVLEIVGKAFLWHQIRCIVTVMFLVGERKERPEIVSELLDVQSHPNKPQYALAAELPLVLYECEFDGIAADDWLTDREAVLDAMDALQSLWVASRLRCAIGQSVMNDLLRLSGTPKQELVPLQAYIVPQLRCGHKPLKERPVSETHLTELGERRVRNNILHRQIAKLLDRDAALPEESEKRPKLEPS